ncbi:hypothetical protein TrRE_jg6266 [Triparma retinervis]|uniref:Peptidase A1 domain-containing protein n=1 Tax=Triparma retinervis TaxID=2557542 RepID=A0A9W7CD71_9STRA|nr:hypothetical protein TrRE_jg6266 [Triparma retinervis]
MTMQAFENHVSKCISKQEKAEGVGSSGRLGEEAKQEKKEKKEREKREKKEKKEKMKEKMKDKKDKMKDKMKEKKEKKEVKEMKEKGEGKNKQKNSSKPASKSSPKSSPKSKPSPKKKRKPNRPPCADFLTAPPSALVEKIDRSAKAACPICSRMFRSHTIQVHVEQCLMSSSRGQAGGGSIRRVLYGASSDVEMADGIACFSFPAHVEGQSVNLILDTGSSDTWVFEGPSFSSSSSVPASFQLSNDEVVSDVRYNVSYLDGSHMELMAYLGSMKIGEGAAFMQAFGAGEPDKATLESFRGFDGISGFAFQEVSVIRAPTPIQSITPPHFGLYLPPRSANPESNPGVLTLGETNSTHFEGTELTYYSLKEISLADIYPEDFLTEQGVSFEDAHKKEYFSGFWDVVFEDMSLNGEIIQSNITAILDSGTTNLVGPESAVRNILETLNAMCLAFKFSDINEYMDDPSLDLWRLPKKLYPCTTSEPPDSSVYFTDFGMGLVDCSAPLDMSLTIEGDTYTLTSDNLLFPFDICGEGMTNDCIGQCFPLNDDASKDGTCDEGATGVFTNCPRFQCNGPERCVLALQAFPNPGGGQEPQDQQGPFSMAKTWLMGDTFMRGVYVGHNYAERSVGLAHSIHPDVSEPDHSDDREPIHSDDREPIHSDDREPIPSNDENGSEEVPKATSNDQTNTTLIISVSFAAALAVASFTLLRGRKLARPAARGFSTLELSEGEGGGGEEGTGIELGVI